MHHNYWLCALEQQQEKPLQWEASALHLEKSHLLPQLEKGPHSNEDPAQSKMNKPLKKKLEKLSNVSF